MINMRTCPFTRGGHPGPRMMAPTTAQRMFRPGHPASGAARPPDGQPDGIEEE